TSPPSTSTTPSLSRFHQRSPPACTRSELSDIRAQLLQGPKPVSHAAHRLDQLVLRERSQLRHMLINCPLRAEELLTPYPVEQVGSREHSAWVSGQERQQVELAAGQRQRLPA